MHLANENAMLSEAVRGSFAAERDVLPDLRSLGMCEPCFLLFSFLTAALSCSHEKESGISSSKSQDRVYGTTPLAKKTCMISTQGSLTTSFSRYWEAKSVLNMPSAVMVAFSFVLLSSRISLTTRMVSS